MNSLFSTWRNQTVGMKLLTDYSVMIIDSFEAHLNTQSVVTISGPFY